MEYFVNKLVELGRLDGTHSEKISTLPWDHIINMFSCALKQVWKGPTARLVKEHAAWSENQTEPSQLFDASRAASSADMTT